MAGAAQPVIEDEAAVLAQARFFALMDGDHTPGYGIMKGLASLLSGELTQFAAG